MNFKPSQYQQDIFEFVKYGYGNAVISAVSGAGKTSTVVKALDFIKPDKKVLFLAFNNSIANELKLRIVRQNTDVKTLHSLGFSILRSNFKDKDITVYQDKYRDKLFNYLTETDNKFITQKRYIENILKLCDLGRFYLVKDTNDLIKISNKYGIILINDELEISLYLIRWSTDSLNEQNTIDYTDMVYLPNVLNVKVFKYDFIFVDEAQDLSTSQMGLFMKCLKQGSRFIGVGDKKQCINSFAGSDIQSFNKLINLPNTIELPLSISYRCPKNIVKYAQRIVPEIQYDENAIDGIINFNASIQDLIDGDMVICRNTLPLIKLYVELINNNIKCYIKGYEIGLNLLEFIQSIDENDVDKLLSRLDTLLFQHINSNKLINSESDMLTSQTYDDLVDKIECIKLLSIGIKTKNDLINKITSIFSNENETGICLSTIHKSKGLEADNVYILDRNLIPSKFAKQEWEMEQERNLEYVSYTRAKKILGFIYSK